MVTFPRDSRSKAKVFRRPRACRHGREEASQAAADVFAASPDLSAYPALNVKVDTLISRNGEEGMN